MKKRNNHSSMVQEGTSNQAPIPGSSWQIIPKRRGRPPGTPNRGGRGQRRQFSPRKLVRSVGHADLWKSSGEVSCGPVQAPTGEVSAGPTVLAPATAENQEFIIVCGVCNSEDPQDLDKEIEWVECDLCAVWFHQNCLQEEQRAKITPEDEWYCHECNHRISEGENDGTEEPKISEDEGKGNSEISVSSEDEEPPNGFKCGHCKYYDDLDGMVVCAKCDGKYHMGCISNNVPFPSSGCWICTLCSKSKH